MYLESLARMPFSHISKILEILTQNKVPVYLANRFRNDPEFAKKVCRMIVELTRDYPGREFILNVDRSKSRLDLIQELRAQNFMTLKDYLITAIEPSVLGPYSATDPLAVKVFLASIYEDANEKQAFDILDHMGFECITAEEALSFALQYRGALSGGYKIVTLAARWNNPAEPRPQFLDLGVTMAGQYTVGFCSNCFDADDLFLVKEKSLSPP